MTSYYDLPRVPMAELPALITSGLADRRDVHVITSAGTPVCLAVSHTVATLTAHGKGELSGVDNALRLRAAEAAEIPGDLVHIVRRAGRLVMLGDAPGGGCFVALIPIEWARELYPTPRAAESP